MESRGNAGQKAARENFYIQQEKGPLQGEYQKILINSKSARLLAVRKVTQDNRGKRPGLMV